jgi:metallo-beta-lactamase family protein
MMVGTTRAADKPKITFLGAAHAVTGSMHLVEACGRRVLLDCGRVRATHHSNHQPTEHFPFAPHTIDAVVLSHAHIDHCGNLPSLVRHGFSGPIYCTPATRDLLKVVLNDSAKFQSAEAFVDEVVKGPGPSGSTHWSARAEVEQTLGQCVTLPYGVQAEIMPDFGLSFTNAGHILGSAMVSLAIDSGPRRHLLTFTGDLGRGGSPLVGDPQPIPACGTLVSESTYGSRTVPPLSVSARRLEEIVAETVDRGGKVLVPAFGLGRTQVVAQCLYEAVRQGRLRGLPIYVDSPLGADIADVFAHHIEPFRAQQATKLVRYLRSTEESRELSETKKPCVIIAPSGMCEGGRIVRHLKETIDDERCTVVLVSYQAPGTLGQCLMQPGPRIRIHGHSFNRWADFVELPGFSGHADRNELLALLKPLADDVQNVQLVHGETEQAESLAAALRELGFDNVGIPRRGEGVFLA